MPLKFDPALLSYTPKGVSIRPRPWTVAVLRVCLWALWVCRAAEAGATGPAHCRLDHRMQPTASSAIGEISSAPFLPLRAVALMSASSKNLRRACDQHSALRTGAGLWLA